MPVVCLTKVKAAIQEYSVKFNLGNCWAACFKNLYRSGIYIRIDTIFLFHVLRPSRFVILYSVVEPYPANSYSARSVRLEPIDHQKNNLTGLCDVYVEIF